MRQGLGRFSCCFHSRGLDPTSRLKTKILRVKGLGLGVFVPRAHLGYSVPRTHNGRSVACLRGVCPEVVRSPLYNKRRHSRPRPLGVEGGSEMRSAAGIRRVRGLPAGVCCSPEHFCNPAR